MNKKTVTYIAIVAGIILLWLLWRNRSKSSPQIVIDAPTSYLDTAYPQLPFATAGIVMPKSNASCGCNPEASKILSSSYDKIKAAEDTLDKQLKDYTDSINNYFETTVFQ